MRVVVVEGSETDFKLAVDEVAALGWQVEPGFAPPYRTGQVARAAAVRSATDAEAALLAAIAGQSVIAHAIAGRDIVDRLVDDLRRLAAVDHRITSRDEAPAIEPEGRALLGLLAEGHSLGEAAEILGLSRRTADRRLAAARGRLGTARTTEAIVRAGRLGWLQRSTDTRP